MTWLDNIVDYAYPRAVSWISSLTGLNVSDFGTFRVNPTNLPLQKDILCTSMYPLQCYGLACIIKLMGHDDDDPGID